MTLYERIHGTAPDPCGCHTFDAGHCATCRPAPGRPAPRELPTDGAYPTRGVASARYTFGTPTRTRQDRAPMG